jgi:hypothetical protein
MVPIQAFETSKALNRAYNAAVSRRTTLDEVFELLCERQAVGHLRIPEALGGPSRVVDVMHSLAGIGKALACYEAQPRRS